MDQSTDGRVVRPFGLLGSRNSVTARGLVFYRAAWAVVLAYVLSHLVIQPHHLLSWTAAVPFFVAITAIFALLRVALRNGRKISRSG